MKLHKTLLLIFLSFSLLVHGQDKNSDTKSIAQTDIVKLSPEEVGWIKAHPEITLGFVRNIAPAVIQAENGELSGFLVDIYKELEELTGLKVKIDLDEWSSSVRKAIDGETDGLLAAVPELIRESHLTPTRILTMIVPVIYARDDASFTIDSRQDLEGKKIAVQKGTYLVDEYLGPLRNTPGIIEVQDGLELMKMVFEGKVDAVVGLNLHAYYIDRFYLSHVRPVLLVQEYQSVSVAGIRSDWPELVSIMNKGLDAIGPTRLAAIQKEWTQIDMNVSVIDAGKSTITQEGLIDQTTSIVIWISGVFAILLLILFAYWLREGRPKQFNIKLAIPMTGTAFIGLVVTTSILIMLLLQGVQSLENIENNKYVSLKLAYELKQSSDDLTRFARTYTITGDPRHEKYFHIIKRIRDGKQAHPEGFSPVFWDQVSADLDELNEDGETYSITERIKSLGLSEREMEKLEKAKYESDNLIKLEEIAIHAVKGYYKDEEGEFTLKGKPNQELARELLHGEEYHAAKANIMTPINDFIVLLEARTEYEIQIARSQNKTYLLFITVLIILTILFGIFTYLLARRRIYNPLKALKDVVLKIGIGDYSHVLEIKTKDEFGDLGAAFNTMSRSIYDRNQELEETNLEFEKARKAAISIMHDANRQKKITEQALVDLEISTAELKKLSRAIEQSPATVIITSKEGIIEYVNPQFSAITGYEIDEAIGKKPSILKSGEMPDAFYKELWTVISTGNIWQGEFLNKNKNGEFYWELASISPIKNNAGIITHYVAVKEDITKRKKLEKDLDNERFFLQELLDSSPIAVSIATDDTIIQYANERFIELSGLKEGDTSFDRFVHADDANYIVNELVNQRIIYGFDSQVYNDKNEIIEILANYLPIEYKGKPSILGWIVNISKLKEIERQLHKAKDIAEEATRAKSSFLASMSHEIRTPMNAVIGLSHLAMQTDLNPKQYDYLYKIQSSGKALLGIINDILDFSKIEAGKLSIEKTNFDLEKVFNDVATVITYKAHEKGLEVVFNIHDKVPFSLVGDPLRLGQVLINLCNNAVKFTMEGEILVEVELEKTLKDSVWLKFQVRDSGIGIKKDQIKKLFESFTQADRSTSREYGGSGLGLAISKNIVELMDGNIWADSEYGKGSTFSFNINLKLQKDQKRKNLLPSVDLRKMKVLVCDDNPTSLEVLSYMLQSFTFQVKAMLSGAEALAELEKPTSKPYELVILDWKMPGLDGIEVAEKIKANKKLASTPTIIMVTAYTREQVIKKVDEMELAGLLTKPVSHSTMFDTIMEAFGKDVQRKQSDQLIASKYEEKLSERKGARILLVEDIDINQQVATEMLEAGGFIVEIANNGLEAINRLNKKADFDLVFMDLQMPVMDGITASEKLRNDKKFDHIPIVAMTADVVGEIKEKCLEIGMNGFVAKPISPESVFEAIIKWVKPGKRDISQLKDKAPSEQGQKIKIPDIKGINIAEGLNRVNNNRKLYQNLLLKFYNSNINLVELIKKAYKSGDEETALRLVHTVKGVSGNIGANEFHSKINDLERKLKEKDFEDLNVLLDVLSNSLNPLLEAIAAYKKSLKAEAKVEIQDDGAELDRDKFKKLLDELKVSLEENDMDATEKVDSILKLPGLGAYSEQFVQINAELENYDFDAAIEIVKRINSS